MKTDKEITAKEKKRQEIRKKLLMQKDELLSGAGITRNALPDETLFPELGDQALRKSIWLYPSIRIRERKLLKKIEEAVEQIDSGTYGICEICGQEISLKRLEARPVTTMCIDCKTEQEEEEKLREK